MRLLVTGASGFVGGHMMAYVRGAHPGVEVYGLFPRRAASAAEAPSGVTLLQADLDDAASVRAALEGPGFDRVVHLAGQSSVRHSWADPGGTLRTNALGVVHLLDALRRSAPRARVLVVGSADEYGIVAPEELPLREQRPPRPASPYAVSKLAQALLALQYDEPGGLSVVVTRTFPHSGPGRGAAFAESSFARQIAEIEAGRRAPALEVGNLEAIRDFTDVRDVVRAYWLLLERGRAREVYNVCSGRGRRLRELLDCLVRLAGVEVEVRVDAARLRPLDLPALVGDPGKLQADTGWRPSIPLETTLRDLLEDWRRRVAGGEAIS